MVETTSQKSVPNGPSFVCNAPITIESKESTLGNLKYLVVGLLFGIVFVKAEIISWFRIQEMFRLDSFHMYGVIGSAVVIGMLSVLLAHQTLQHQDATGRTRTHCA